MGAERAEALEVLRDVWRGQAQTAADLDDSCVSHCKKMTDAGVGFDDYAAGDATDRITAWRARLERGGKLGSPGTPRTASLRGGPVLSVRASSAPREAFAPSSCGRPKPSNPPLTPQDSGP